jgi:hypothetical protein
MRLNRTSTAFLCAGATLLFACTSAWSQQTRKNCVVQDENGKNVVWPDCKDPNAPATVPATPTDPNAVPAAKQFPFPGEPPATTTPSTDPNAPAAKQFPFPGEPATDTPTADPRLKDAGSSGSAPPPDSSSSSSSDPQGGAVGPLADYDDDPAAKSAAERKAARHKLPPVPRQSPDERVAEDLQVASFYMDDKNYRGAYSRATDAVAIAADDPNTQFALAEAARRLGKLDEALTHYKKCLTLDPIPKVKKSAEKAIKDMSGSGSSSLMP